MPVTLALFSLFSVQHQAALLLPPLLLKSHLKTRTDFEFEQRCFPSTGGQPSCPSSLA